MLSLIHIFQEGIDFGCATVCINPASLDIAAELTKGTDTKICVVCDFPFGLSTTASKVMQAEEYCKRGDVFELDIVANYGWIRSGMYKEVEADIKAVVDVCHKYGTAVKVIIEDVYKRQSRRRIKYRGSARALYPRY